MDYQSQYQSVADSVAQKYGIPTSIFSSMITKESGWNPYSVNSNRNGTIDVGLAQLNSATTAGTGVNAWDPAQNLNAAGSMLSNLFSKYGNWNDALAAYNAGPNNIQAGQQYANDVLSAATSADKSVALNQVAPSLSDYGIIDQTPTSPLTSPSAGQPGSTLSSNGPSFWSDPIGYIKSAGLGLGAAVLAIGLIGFGVYATVRNETKG